MKDFVVKEDRLSEKERRTLSILDSIRRHKEISRAEISKLTDLNIVTVSNYVNKYVKDKLVFEVGLDVSSGGRRPELLKLNEKFGYSIGVDLGPPALILDASIVAVMLDMSGKVVAKEKVPRVEESFEKLTERVVDVIEKLIIKSGVPRSDVKGIGVGIWGVIDRYRGMVRFVDKNEHIVNYTAMVSQLENIFGVPTLIEHDAAAAAFGEKWAGIGVASATDNLVYMCSDCSCGLVIRGELYYGASRSAGELNLNPLRSGAKEEVDDCWASHDYGCCLRSRGLDLGIPEKAKAYLEEHPEEKENSIMLKEAHGEAGSIVFKTVIESADKGDIVAKKILEEAGAHLGVKIAFLINIFNPEAVVIGRGIENAGDIFFSAVRKSIRRWGYEEFVKVVKIFPSSLEGDGVAIGAGALVIQNVFAQA